MKRIYILIVCAILLAAVLCGCGISPSMENEENAQTESEAGLSAEEQRAQALSAYQEILKAAPAIEGEHEELSDASFGYEQNLEMFGKHYDLFALFDINRDGIPELLAMTTVNFRWTPISVFTYSDGNAVLLKDPLEAEAHGTFEQKSTANGACYIYFCEEDHIHSVWRGTTPTGEEAEENSAYALEGTTLTAADCALEESENTVYFSDIAVANTEENADRIVEFFR